MSKSNKDKFNFWVPAQLSKGKNEKDQDVYWIEGIASSATEDSDGETLIPEGFSYDYLLDKGYFNYNHMSSKDPGAYIGEPTEAKVINEGKDFWVKGFIYPEGVGLETIKLAKRLEKYSPNRRLGFSIEGQAISRDPVFNKRILKARVTGIAVTACPKNKNTLLSLIKGEYEEPFIDEEDEDDEEIKKDMDTTSIAPTAKENVAHSSPAKQHLKELTKSQVVERILDKYNLYDNNFVFINKIYNFVKSINGNAMTEKNTITEDTLQKAFDVLDNISKGESTVVEDKQPEAIVPASAESEIKKSEDGDDDMDDMAKSMYAEGKSKEECVEGMVRKGFGLVASQGAVEKVVAAANALKENGGTVTPANAPIVKAEDVAKLVLDEITKSFGDNIQKSLDPLNDKITKGFGAVSSLLKTQEEENKLLKSQIDTLAGKIETIEKAPLAPKSVRNVNAVDRFAKSEDGGLPNGFREVSVSDSIQKSLVLGELSTNFDLSKSDDEREVWGGAMRRIEAVGLAYLDPKIANILKIKLVA